MAESPCTVTVVKVPQQEAIDDVASGRGQG
jgi:hypothetical protein